MRRKPKIVNGIAIDCRFVEEGTTILEGREITWQSGSRIFLVVEGERAVTKYRVNPNAEKKVAAFFEEAPFGVYCALSLDADGLMIDAKTLTA